MPNWVYNNIIISGDSEKVEAVKAQLDATTQKPETETTSYTTENPIFSFWNIVRPSASDFEAYRDQGWYDWNVTNWGTKWDASDVEVTDNEPGLWSVYFQTAWAPPHEALVALSDQHPEVSIRNEWREEQGYGAYQEYLAGVHWVDKEWNIPESHAEFAENLTEEDCPCSYSADSEWTFDDCPIPANETKFAVAELEKVSETI